MNSGLITHATFSIFAQKSVKMTTTQTSVVRGVTTLIT